MKEIRPATWIALGVMALLVFVPALFIDMDDFANAPARENRFYTTPPRGPQTGPQGPQVPDPPPRNQPDDNSAQDGNEEDPAPGDDAQPVE